MYHIPAHNDWNEFQWEAEIRKDELRISRYFKALAGCLDLPGEEDMIYRRLMAQPELVPTGVDASAAVMRDIFEGASNGDDDEDGDWDNDGGDWRRKPGTEACRRIEYLAGEWNALAATLDIPDPLTAALRITCLFGRLLSRVYNLSDSYSDTPVSLRVSLLKRVLADINDLLGALAAWDPRSPVPNDRMEWLMDQLQHFREAVIDSLNQHRIDPGSWSGEND